MPLTIEQILGYESMHRLITTRTTGLRRPLPDAFYASSIQTQGASGIYLRVEGTREVARLVRYGAPSRRREQTGVSEVPVKLLHTFEQHSHGPEILAKLLDENESRQKLGRSEIIRHTQIFKQRFENLRTAAIGQALGRGNVWFDADGGMLGTSGGAAIAIDYGIPAGNRNQLNWDGGGAIIAASWATAATDIPAHVEHLHQAAAKLTGYPVEVAIYGRNIFSYLNRNDYVTKWLSGNPAMQNGFARYQIPAGFLGIAQWIPAWDAFFADDAGTYHDLFPVDGITFCPQPSPDWWDVMEGTYVVPRNVGNITGDGIASLSDIEEVRGMFTYARVSHDPAGIVQYAGDTFLPIISVPRAVWLADVTP